MLIGIELLLSVLKVKEVAFGRLIDFSLIANALLLLNCQSNSVVVVNCSHGKYQQYFIVHRITN